MNQHKLPPIGTTPVYVTSHLKRKRRKCELDAISPDMLRTLVDNAIRRHADTEQVPKLKRIEQFERQTMKSAWGLLSIAKGGAR